MFLLLFFHLFVFLSQTIACTPFINEVHYDNAGSDTGEAVEVAALGGTDLTKFQLVFYNGLNGQQYGSASFSSSATSTEGNWGFVSTSFAGIQNGAPDAIALINESGSVIDFISYKGTMTAVDGPASGQTSNDIGVSESGSTPIGYSLQKSGSGCSSAEFSWQSPSPDSFENVNVGQVFEGCSCFEEVTNDGDVWINEIHYLNQNSDTNQGFEIAAPAGSPLTGWIVYLYEGKNNSKSWGKVYQEVNLQDMPRGSGYGFQFYSVKLSDGKSRPAGLALVDDGSSVKEFISYGGTISVVGGPADRKISRDIGTEESTSTLPNESLQLIGTGSKSSDFSWVGPFQNTRNAVNTGQNIQSGGDSNTFVRINELHYNNDGTDVNEAVELVGEAGGNLDGWSIYFYNGNGGGEYDNIQLTGTFTDAVNGFGFIVFTKAGIQNGPDGIALIAPNGTAVEFLCYEGTFTATDGPANGKTCSDIGAEEAGSTPADYSVQKSGCGLSSFWKVDASTFGSINDGQTLSSSNCPEAPNLRIFEVQGSGLSSIYEGDRVTVSGVVTAVTSSSFFLQDIDGDGDISTSDGILIFLGVSPTVSVGDLLNVTGIVEEFVSSNSPYSQPVTELTSASWSVISTGNTLPPPVIIGSGGRIPPTESIPAGISFYESLEGMRVVVSNPLVIAPRTRFAEYWTIVDGGSGASGLSARNALVLSESDFNPERVQVDYNSGVFSGFTAPEAQVGDSMSSVTGVLSYSFGSYEVIATEAFSISSGFLARQTTSLSKSDTALLVASMNTLNLDPLDGSQFSELASIVVNNLASPDVIALQEVQDNDGPTNSDIVSASETLQMLINAIANASGPTYAFVENTFIGDDRNGGEPGGNIRCSFIYLNSRLEFLSKDTVADPTDQQTNPANPFYNSRLPLVANFRSRQTGNDIQLVNVHFSSKGGSAPVFGTQQPFNDLQDNPKVNGNVDDRLEQANAVATYVSNSPYVNKVILGDCNEFQFNSPVQAMGQGFTILMNSLPVNERYSYNFEGNAQALDQILVSDNLASNALFQPVHCNSEFSVQASDHDPLIALLEV